LETDSTVSTRLKRKELQNKFDFYEKRLAWDSIYLNRHPSIPHLMQLAIEYEALAKQISELEVKTNMDQLRKRHKGDSYHKGWLDFFEFFDNNFLQVFSKKYSRIRHRIPPVTETTLFSHFRVFDDIR